MVTLQFPHHGSAWPHVRDGEGQPLDRKLAERWYNAEQKARRVRPRAKLLKVEEPEPADGSKIYWFKIWGENDNYTVKVQLRSEGGWDIIALLCNCGANSKPGVPPEKEYHLPCYHAVAAISAARAARQFYAAMSGV